MQGAVRSVPDRTAVGLGGAQMQACCHGRAQRGPQRMSAKLLRSGNGQFVAAFVFGVAGMAANDGEAHPMAA